MCFYLAIATSGNVFEIEESINTFTIIMSVIKPLYYLFLFTFFTVFLINLFGFEGFSGSYRMNKKEKYIKEREDICKCAMDLHIKWQEENITEQEIIRHRFFAEFTESSYYNKNNIISIDEVVKQKIEDMTPWGVNTYISYIIDQKKESSEKFIEFMYSGVMFALLKRLTWFLKEEIDEAKKE